MFASFDFAFLGFEEGMPRYRILFLNENGRVVGSYDFEAQSGPEATAIAAVLADACSDVCTGFQVWQGNRRISSQWPLNGSIQRIAARMKQATQEAVAEHEERLLRSGSTIAKSRRLVISISTR